MFLSFIYSLLSHPFFRFRLLFLTNDTEWYYPALLLRPQTLSRKKTPACRKKTQYKINQLTQYNKLRKTLPRCWKWIMFGSAIYYFKECPDLKSKAFIHRLEPLSDTMIAPRKRKCPVLSISLFLRSKRASTLWHLLFSYYLMYLMLVHRIYIIPLSLTELFKLPPFLWLSEKISPLFLTVTGILEIVIL